jgi:putative dimethyl sulfoxide reductase chaperone
VLVTSNVKDDVLEILTDRGATYALLSQLLREEVSIDLLERLVADLAGNQAAGDVAGPGYGTLRQFAQRVEHTDLAQVKSELSVEYSRLFLTGRTTGVHPYESVYTSEERLLMQQARDEVLAVYRQEGLAKAKAFKEPEDHLAVEFDFMSLLCEKTSDALADGQTDAALALLDKQQSFLTEHLLVWVPRFCRDLVKAAHSDFYRGVAMVAQEYLNQEAETLAQLAATLRSEQGQVQSEQGQEQS